MLTERSTAVRSGWRFLVPPGETPRSAAPRPSFSVIVAAYNAETTIAEALESAFAQTLAPREVIVVDDGSQDRTAEVVGGWRDRVTLVRTENRGPSAARNTAAQHATGDFLAILDADDVYLPTRLEALAQLSVARPDLDLLITNVLYEQGQHSTPFFDERAPFPTEDQRHAILRRNFVQFPAIRSSVFAAHGGFDEALLVCEDWDLWMRMILGGARVGAVDVPLLRYRRHAGSLASDDERIIHARVGVLRRRMAEGALDDEELAVADAACTRSLALLDVVEARESLIARRSGTRRRMLEVSRNPHLHTRVRLRALGAAIAPSVARALWSADGRTSRRPPHVRPPWNEPLAEETSGSERTPPP